MHFLRNISKKEGGSFSSFWLWSIASFVSVLTSSAYIYYLLFGLQCIHTIFREGVNKTTILQLSLYSVLLPNNYIPIAFCLAECLLIIDFVHVKKSSLLVILFIGIGFFLSSIINAVPFPNILFSLVYALPSILTLIILRDNWNVGMAKKTEDTIHTIFWILFSSTIANYCGKLLGIYRPIPGDDWSTGTFGDGQGNPLFMIVAIIFLYKLNDILKHRDVVFMICAFVMLFASHSFVLFATFVFAFLISVVIKYGVFKTAKVIIPIFILAIIVLNRRGFDIMLLNIIKNFSWDSFTNFMPKANVILGSLEVMFNSIGNFIFGVGPGQYSSRAAATCTGLYVNSYNKLFSPSISSWTNEYVYPYMYRAVLNSGGADGSILRLPYSSIASIIGEYGLFGIISGICVNLRLIIKSNKSAFITLFFFFTACFFDNWLEYIKVVLVLTVCLCLCKKERFKKTYE